jgi:hypothetical protein
MHKTRSIAFKGLDQPSFDPKHPWFRSHPMIRSFGGVLAILALLACYALLPFVKFPKLMPGALAAVGKK